MAKELTDQERAIIQQAILDRWNPHRLTKKICDTFGLSVNQVRHIRSKATFKAEYWSCPALVDGYGLSATSPG
jgi:DNA-directed RNA polymerase sigma subunit (sigma70/sigma32)